MKLNYLLGFLLTLAPAATAQTTQPAFRPRTFVTYTGAYSSTVKYAVNDMVTLGGVAYISIAANNLGNAVTSTSWWTAFATPPAPAAGVTTSANIYVANGIAQADAVTHATTFGLQTFGDSLTFGQGATTTANAWPSLVAAHYGISSGFANHGTGGDRAMDMANKVLSSLNPGDFGNPIVTGMIGASEAVAGPNVPLAANTLAAYTKNLYAAAIWAGVSSKWKWFINGPYVSASGGISTGFVNLLNPSATGIAQQSYMTYADGVVHSYPGNSFAPGAGYYTVTDFIPVTAGASYTTNVQTCGSGTCGMEWFNSSQGSLSGQQYALSGGNTGSITLTAPPGAAFIRITTGSALLASQMFGLGTTLPGTYVPYGASTGTGWLVENSFPYIAGASIAATGTATAANALVSPSGVFYLLFRSNPTDGFMHVTIDGVPATDTLTGLTSITGNWTGDNANSASVSGAAARYVATPGFHSIAVVWESGTIAPYAFIFPQPRTRGKSAPFYVVGGMGTSYGLTHAVPYAQVQAVALGMSKQLTADGLDTPFVDISQVDPNGYNGVAYGACPASQAPPLHGNDCINAQMAGYFESVINGAP